MRRRLAIALSATIVILALAPGAGLARGPQKNDSVSGHGFVLTTPATTDSFRVSAHAVGSATTAATGNMFLRTVTTDVTGTTTISIWADVYCVSAETVLAEVRGHIYRTEPDLLTEPTDLIFNVTDLHPVTSGPDLFQWTAETTGVSSCVAPSGGLEPVAKGSVTVNDEGP